MAEKAGFLNYQMHAVHQQGAPGLDWGMENARALGNAGNAIANGIGDTAKAFMDHDLLQLRFDREKQATDDRLNLAKLRNAYDSVYNQLDNDLRDNPGMDRDSARERVEGSRLQFDDLAQPIYKAMSPETRALAYEQVEGWNLAGAKRRDDIMRQNYVTGALNESKIVEEQMLADGRFDDWSEYVKSQTGLYSQSAIQAKLAERPRLEDEWDARRKLDAGDPQLTEWLTKKDADGRFVNWPNMSDAYRSQLIRASESADASRRNDVVENFLNQCYNGERPKARDVAGGDISLENSLIRIEEQFAAQDQREAEKAAKAAMPVEKSDAKKMSDFADSMELAIYELNWPSDADGANVIYRNLRSDINTQFASEPSKRLDLLKKLDAKYKEFSNPDVSVKNTAGYQYLMQKIGDNKNADEFFASQPGRLWGTRKADDPEITLTNQQQMKLAAERWIQNHPDATTAEMNAWYDATKKQVNETDVKNIMQFWTGLWVMDGKRPEAEQRQIDEREKIASHEMAADSSGKSGNNQETSPSESTEKVSDNTEKVSEKPASVELRQAPRRFATDDEKNRLSQYIKNEKTQKNYRTASENQWVMLATGKAHLDYKLQPLADACLVQFFQVNPRASVEDARRFSAALSDGIRNSGNPEKFLKEYVVKPVPRLQATRDDVDRNLGLNPGEKLMKNKRTGQLVVTDANGSYIRDYSADGDK